MQLDVMRAFRRCCPFHKEIRGEIVVAIRKGAAEWFTFELQRYQLANNKRHGRLERHACIYYTVIYPVETFMGDIIQLSASLLMVLSSSLFIFLLLLLLLLVHFSGDAFENEKVCFLNSLVIQHVL
jgi:hypothetical protein